VTTALGRLALGAAALLLAAGAAPAAAAGPDCALGSGIHLVGLDTASGQALLSLPGSGGGSYLVVWRQGEERARSFREAEDAGRFGGSVGPGPVFAFARCGRGCLQPMRFEEGRGEGPWRPLGEPILAPHAATVHGTHDLDGTPWVVIHGSPVTAGERAGTVSAWAFRLEGREWRPAGRLEVGSVAVPGALPAPWLPDAVVSGTGLFSAAGEPRQWLAGLPAGRSGPGSQVLPFGGPSGSRAAAFLSPEGSIYRSGDTGGSWRLASWRPWEATGTAEPWERGDDYSVDIATGVPGAALPVLWFDRRLAGRERLVFSEMTPAGAWREVAVGPARLPTSAGDELTVSHVLRGPGQRWSALFGCVASGGRPRLVVVEVTGGQVGEPRLVPVEAGAGPAPR
jgi:hypothetical protein